MASPSTSRERLTFRGTCDGTAWQKQLRDRHLNEGTPPVPHLEVKRAQVRPVGRKLAEQVILKYEWLGTMSQTRRHFGIFFGSYCAGVCCVGVGCTGGANVHQPFRVEPSELLILARGACVHWAPTGANSKLVAWTCRLLQRDHAGKLLIAYSDTDAGEIGTIYQACNWTYIGPSASTRQWVAPNGRVYDAKQPANLAKTRGGTRARWADALRKAGWYEQPSNPKHRYVSLLDPGDRALRDRVEKMRLPYPKRERGADGGAAVPTAGGGSSPTRSLSEVP